MKLPRGPIAFCTATLLYALSASAQRAATSAAKPGPAALSKEQVAGLEKTRTEALQTLTSEVNQRIATLKAAQEKSKTAQAEAVRSHTATKIPGDLKNRKVQVDSTLPYVDEVYSAGPIRPYGTVLVIGGNLGSYDTEYHITLNGKDLRGSPMPATCTLERCWITTPDWTGIAEPTQASLTVKKATTGKTSSPAPITLSPELVQKELDIGAMKASLLQDYRGTRLTYAETTILVGSNGFTLVDANTVWGYHSNPGPKESSETDEYFLTTTLKNHWVVKEVVFKDLNRKQVGDNAFQSSCGLTDAKRDTASPYVKVAWWTLSANQYQAVYMIRYIVEGPKGTSPF